jgi:hypothetical protein
VSADAPTCRAPADAFAFGRNWQRYVDAYLDPERIEIARAPEVRAPGPFLRVRSSTPRFVGKLAQGDVVYSWGLLHNTGDMCNGIRQAARLGGLFVVAICNREIGRFLDSDRRQRIKAEVQPLEPGDAARHEGGIPVLLDGTAAEGTQEPDTRTVTARKPTRGMAFKTDLFDWLGGYPYEYATADEIVGLCRDQLGLDVVKVLSNPPTGTGNNQFVFRRAEAIEDAG